MTGSWAFSVSPAPSVPSTPTVTTERCYEPSEGTDTELAALHATVDNLTGRVADLTAAVARVERTIRDALQGDGR